MARQKVISNRRKQKQKPDPLKELLQMSERALHKVVSAYMLLMIVILPFYFTDGYANIGTDKYNFFYKGTCGIGIIFVFFLLHHLGVRVCLAKREYGKEWLKKECSRLVEALSVTDRFVLGYGIVVILSYFFSDYKTATDAGNAFTGINRWYLGLRTQLLLVVIYFAVSRFWKKNKWLPTMWLPVTLVTFVLGYLNRFEVRPFEMKNTTSEFISTIGNMNWYCGYIVIIIFGGVFTFWLGADRRSRENYVMAIWMTIGFATLITQGSSSGLVVLFCMMLILYLLSQKEEEKLIRFSSCFISLGFACAVTYFVRKVWPERFNYQDGIVDMLTDSPLAIGLFAGSIVLYVLLILWQKEGKVPMRQFTLLGYGACCLIALALLVFLVLGLINTKYPGSLGKLSEVSALTFSLEWGSYRGATWVAGFQCFADQDWLGKLFGVGPDSMALYIQSGQNEEVLSIVRECFGNKLLTNGHSEWLTVLVNNGVLGLICYAGLFVSAIFRYLKAPKANSIAGACGFAILAYTINNMFSFQQIMSAVTIFMVLGMGEAFVSEKRHIDKI